MDEKTNKRRDLVTNDEFQTQLSMESKSVNSVFGSVPTKVEADWSIQAVQSYLDDEGQGMMVKKDSRFQPAINGALQLINMPMVKEAVTAVMCNAGVYAAMMNIPAVQSLFKTMPLGKPALLLTNGEFANTTAKICKSSKNLVAYIFSWIKETMQTGIVKLIDFLSSLLNNTTGSGSGSGSGSTQNGIPSFGSDTGQVLGHTLFLSVFNLLIVFARRMLNPMKTLKT